MATSSRRRGEPEQLKAGLQRLLFRLGVVGVVELQPEIVDFMPQELDQLRGLGLGFLAIG